MMSWIMSHPIISLSYGFLYLSVVLLWFSGKKKIPSWGIALFTSIILGLISHQLEMTAVVSILLLGFSAYYSQTQKVVHTWVRVIAGIVVIVLSIGLATHQLPRFHNLNVLDHVYISSNAIPFTLYLNFDKTIVGILFWVLALNLFQKKMSGYCYVSK